MDQIPLNSEASQGDTHKQTTSTLPPDVVQCLDNARFVDLPRTTNNAITDRRLIIHIASLGNMHRQRAACLSNELYISSIVTLF